MAAAEVGANSKSDEYFEMACSLLPIGQLTNVRHRRRSPKQDCQPDTGGLRSELVSGMRELTRNGTWLAAWACWLLGCLGSELLAQTTPNDSLDFSTDVLPIVQRHCYACHSHQSGSMEGGLSLDWRSGWELGGDRGPAISPGKPDESLLVRAVRHTDPDLQMPAEKISDAEISILERWIEQGAIDPRIAEPTETGLRNAQEWWALRSLVRPHLPLGPNAAPPSDPLAADSVTNPSPITRSVALTPLAEQNPIDLLVDRELAARGLTPQPQAERHELIRRLWIDLLGLQPTVEDVAAFEQDTAAGAWQRLVEDCLSRPQYAERWARHWLDTAHFADSHGFEHDVFRPHAWPYRDYVIDALHRDMPW